MCGHSCDWWNGSARWRCRCRISRHIRNRRWRRRSKCARRPGCKRECWWQIGRAGWNCSRAGRRAGRCSSRCTGRCSGRDPGGRIGNCGSRLRPARSCGRPGNENPGGCAGRCDRFRSGRNAGIGRCESGCRNERRDPHDRQRRGGIDRVGKRRVDNILRLDGRDIRCSRVCQRGRGDNAEQAEPQRACTQHRQGTGICPEFHSLFSSFKYSTVRKFRPARV